MSWFVLILFSISIILVIQITTPQFNVDHSKSVISFDLYSNNYVNEALLNFVDNDIKNQKNIDIDKNQKIIIHEEIFSYNNMSKSHVNIVYISDLQINKYWNVTSKSTVIYNFELNNSNINSFQFYTENRTLIFDKVVKTYIIPDEIRFLLPITSDLPIIILPISVVSYNLIDYYFNNNLIDNLFTIRYNLWLNNSTIENISNFEELNQIIEKIQSDILNICEETSLSFSINSRMLERSVSDEYDRYSRVINLSTEILIGLLLIEVILLVGFYISLNSIRNDSKLLESRGINMRYFKKYIILKQLYYSIGSLFVFSLLIGIFKLDNFLISAFIPNLIISYLFYVITSIWISISRINRMNYGFNKIILNYLKLIGNFILINVFYLIYNYINFKLNDEKSLLDIENYQTTIYLLLFSLSAMSIFYIIIKKNYFNFIKENNSLSKLIGIKLGKNKLLFIGGVTIIMLVNILIIGNYINFQNQNHLDRNYTNISDYEVRIQLSDPYDHKLISNQINEIHSKLDNLIFIEYFSLTSYPSTILFNNEQYGSSIQFFNQSKFNKLAVAKGISPINSTNAILVDVGLYNSLNLFTESIELILGSSDLFFNSNNITPISSDEIGFSISNSMLISYETLKLMNFDTNKYLQEIEYAPSFSLMINSVYTTDELKEILTSVLKIPDSKMVISSYTNNSEDLIIDNQSQKTIMISTFILSFYYLAIIVFYILFIYNSVFDKSTRSDLRIYFQRFNQKEQIDRSFYQIQLRVTFVFVFTQTYSTLIALYINHIHIFNFRSLSYISYVNILIALLSNFTYIFYFLLVSNTIIKNIKIKIFRKL